MERERDHTTRCERKRCALCGLYINSGNRISIVLRRLVARMGASHAPGRGSIPRGGNLFADLRSLSSVHCPPFTVLRSLSLVHCRQFTVSLNQQCSTPYTVSALYGKAEHEER